jgi:hypothetical protein
MVAAAGWLGGAETQASEESAKTAQAIAAFASLADRLDAAGGRARQALVAAAGGLGLMPLSSSPL